MQDSFQSCTPSNLVVFVKLSVSVRVLARAFRSNSVTRSSLDSRKHCWKRRNAECRYFLLFPQCFPRAFSTAVRCRDRVVFWVNMHNKNNFKYLVYSHDFVLFPVVLFIFWPKFNVFLKKKKVKLNNFRFLNWNILRFIPLSNTQFRPPMTLGKNN